jgi:2-polyprenyl-6-methoxyphenol hydroxylase-like FAD-dependent oxidoreductase
MTVHTAATTNCKGRALVIGGSLGGLFAANLLVRSGWEAVIYERIGEPLHARGAGIGTHPELLNLLGRAGVSTGQGIGVRVSQRVVFGPDGRKLGECVMPQIMTGWSRLYQLLRAALPDGCYHMGMTLTGIEQDEIGVTAIFAEGERVRGDVLIGADGIRSTSRAIFMPTVKPRYAGYIAWRGLVEERALSAPAHAAIFDKFAFCLPPGEQFLAYPIAGAGDALEPGRRRYNYVWYRPLDARALPGLLTDAEGRQHVDGIPPALVRPELIEELRQEADRRLAPHFAEVVRRTEQPFFQLIYDLESPAMAFGRVAILGDAAFVARPHPAMGLTKAAGDAAALADMLAASDRVSAREALLRWQAARLAVGVAIVEHARHLGAHLQVHINTEEERMMAELHHTPERVIMETAAPPGRA